MTESEAVSPSQISLSISEPISSSSEPQQSITVPPLPPSSIPRRAPSKLREMMQRPQSDSDPTVASMPELKFIYDDCDTLDNEVAELYSYTEEKEFSMNRDSFERYFNESDAWMTLGEEAQMRHVVSLLDNVELLDREARLSALRSLLYLVQGLFGECSEITEQRANSRYNCFLFYKCGVFPMLMELMNMQIEGAVSPGNSSKAVISIADSGDFRVIISILYTVVEMIRVPSDEESEEWKTIRENFKLELSCPVMGDELLADILLEMATRFCSGASPHFPSKKILLLLWKVILFTLGGEQDHLTKKNEARATFGLDKLKEDTIEITRRLRAASPPASAADMLEQQGVVRRPPLMRVDASKKELPKQNAMEEYDNVNPDEVALEQADEPGDLEEKRPDTPPPPTTPPLAKPVEPLIKVPKFLPWSPKVRKKDLEDFLNATRQKFVGFQVANDMDSLIGLPLPIHEGVRILKDHLYVSLAEAQIEKEDLINQNPLSQPETDIPDTAAERLYQGILQNLPQYMIALLKILLAAAPTSKTKSENTNVLSDVLPEEMPTTVVQSMILGIDVNRHKEIIVKAVSAILILLLKHFRTNHIYQFEYTCQHLVFANCVPLVLKFFNQNIIGYVTAKNNIDYLNFPSCVINGRLKDEITAEQLESDSTETMCCWRNMFACVNLLRILNKLTKWKHSRTMMLVVFKSAPILKKALKVRHALLQLYALKLLKIQTKYLGRQWRKSNMKTMSAIYQLVRHRLTDDWAFGNDLDARPWDFQAEECTLRSAVDCFNRRRYSNESDQTDFIPVDNCLQSVVGDNEQQVELHADFMNNYEAWLEREVYNVQIDWDQVLTPQKVFVPKPSRVVPVLSA